MSGENPAVVNSSKLIRELNERSEQSAKMGKVRKRDNEVWGYPDLIITSWKFNEWDFYNPKANLPTQARGLFTLGQDRILLRGYNKFFNVNEVRTTDLEFMRKNTEGPYAATVKENGCIVLIAGLNGKLVVTSKHSSGPAAGSLSRNHSKVGREWVLKHLSRAGRTEEQLATVLEQHNWTAVGELCDDSFEEHVLAYPPSNAGIYLNGLNHNQAEFRTEPPATVNAFGEEWGFLRTEFTEFTDFDSLYAFLLSCAETGKWQGREIEGFVIRCKLEKEDFLFKYKFEEPYLMYRQWREVTRVFLSQGITPAVSMARRGRHAESTFKFLAFASNYIGKHPGMIEKLLVENMGIIELRQQFLNSSGISEQDLLAMSAAADPRWVFVPVATIGCGKTTVGVALTKLFGDEWSHRQNDAVEKKKKRWQSFLNTIVGDLNSHRAVILDRNNGQRQERETIVTDIRREAGAFGYDVKFVCLNFLPEGPTEEIKRLTRSLVTARGDNHLTVKAAGNAAAVNGIMKGFETRFEPVTPNTSPDNEFDSVINLEPGKTRENVVLILNELRAKYDGLAVPEFSEADIDAAVEEAIQYKPEDPANNVSDAMQKPRYFALAIDPEHHATLTRIARELIPEDIMAGLNVLDAFHVTLAHNNSHRALHDELCKKYKERLSGMESNTSVMLGSKEPVRVTQLSWSKNVAAFKVDVSGAANKHSHITVATAEGVSPVVANYLFDGMAHSVVDLPEPIVLEDQELTAYR